MDLSVESLASSGMMQQQMQLAQDVQTSVLKKALDAEASQALQLLQSVPQTPQLATSGMIGTQINTYA